MTKLDYKIIDCGDVLIVGAGLAGLYTALHLNPLKVTILAAAPLEQGASSNWAQGGIAAALSALDSPESHANDTMIAGCNLNDTKIVKILTEEAPARVNDLFALGVPFDKDITGSFILGREAAHTHNRIAKVKGDGAGRAIMHSLVLETLKYQYISVAEPYAAFDLAVKDGIVYGVFARKIGYADPILFKAKAVVFATGGVGHLFKDTTNPYQIRGEGLGMAARHGATIADAEFVQFHPTALNVGKDPCPLATEALRGEGAYLVNDKNERFMLKVHKDAELAPRDVVTRGIWQQMQQGYKVYLDTRHCIGDKFATQFPTVYQYCMEANINPITNLIPVKPAQHYHMGGIFVDDYGHTSLKNLWAVGETACTGAHGANRLASNSLLEAIVFGYRVAQNIHNIIQTQQENIINFQPIHVDRQAGKICLPILRQTMTDYAGVIRHQEGLEKGIQVIEDLSKKSNYSAPFINYATTAKIIMQSALNRKESIGGHFRSDFPQTPKEIKRSFYQ